MVYPQKTKSAAPPPLQVRLDAVEPSRHPLLACIKALKPYTMSWSNVCDYYTPRGKG